MPNATTDLNQRLLTGNLKKATWGGEVTRILAAALQAVDPAAAVRRHVQRQGNLLLAGGRRYELDQYQRVLVVGAGKAGSPMARATARLLGKHLSAGVVIVKEGYAGEPVPGVQLLEAGHPLPDARGVAGAGEVAALLKNAGEHDLVIVLISGGGSALLAALAPGVELDDLQKLTADLLASGATINEINTLRKHLDTLKGGGLARAAAPAPVLTLILSDVVGDPLDVIASGPTVPDPSTFAEAQAILTRYSMENKTPAAITQRLAQGVQGKIADTPKPGDPLFDHVQNIVIGSNHLAAQAALSAAQDEGFSALLLTTFLQGEARQVGPLLAAVLRQAATSSYPIPRPACIVAGGETTVTLQGDGLGGRNQELALSAVRALHGLPDVALVTLATDGGDGPTDAAGAVVTGETMTRAQTLGLDPDDFLHRNDAYHFFDALEDLLKPGPTQTNVNDLTFLFTF